MEYLTILWEATMFHPIHVEGPAGLTLPKGLDGLAGAMNYLAQMGWRHVSTNTPSTELVLIIMQKED